MCPNPHRTFRRFIHRPSSSAAKASHPSINIERAKEIKRKIGEAKKRENER